jgi:hypothetical protein
MRPTSASNSERSAGPTPSASACAANASTRPVASAAANVSRSNDCPLAMVEWEDSAQPLPAWSFLASFEAPGTIRCVSVGWVIRHDNQMLALAPNMGAIDDENSVQISGVIQIPTRCVLKLTRLREPPLTSSGRASGPAPRRRPPRSEPAPGSALSRPKGHAKPATKRAAKSAAAGVLLP